MQVRPAAMPWSRKILWSTFAARISFGVLITEALTFHIVLVFFGSPAFDGSLIINYQCAVLVKAGLPCLPFLNSFHILP